MTRASTNKDEDVYEGKEITSEMVVEAMKVKAFARTLVNNSSTEQEEKKKK